MKTFATILGTTILFAGFGTSALASSPDIYVVNFRNDKSAESQRLDQKLESVLPFVAGNIETVIIDTSTAARWEKGAHEAFDRDIVPVFNKWVGLPGFAAIVDADTKKVIGCVNGMFEPTEIAREIENMQAKAKGKAFLSRASVKTKTTECPPAHNTPPQ